LVGSVVRESDKRAVLEPAERSSGSGRKDFERCGLDIWEQVDAMRSGNDERRKKLEALITWRNAIAHHDIDAKLNRGALEPASSIPARAGAEH
jgi:hypothetical protein